MKRSGSASDPLWYKDAIIYELPVKAFCDSNQDGIGDFGGLLHKLDYLQNLGVTCLWLLPFFPSPLRDDGYDISNYCAVHPSYGTLEEFRAFLDAAHARDMQVMIELVVNHTSDQHPWFQAARQAAPNSPERNRYVWSDDDHKLGGARIIFTDTEKSNWTWDPVAKAYFWHRFFSHQPDLNFDNPDVLREVLEAMRFWLDQGVDGLRLDAIPYLVEREGTSCENLPETHTIIRQIRAALDERYANRMILAEANQLPVDVRPYFGEGDECHMAFHFPLMPRLFMALRLEDRQPIVDIMADTPEIPASCQWGLFLRNHDELTLEMVSDRERDYMYLAYSADPRMRVNVGIRRRLAPLLDNNRRRIELLKSILLSFPGTPILYYGDEIGMGDNIYLGDRNGVRTPMQWSGDRNAGFSRALPERLYSPVLLDPVYGYQSVNVEAQLSDSSSLLHWTRNMIGLRKLFKVFGRGGIEFLRPSNRKILAYLRISDKEKILCVANLSRFAQPVELDLARFQGVVPVEMLGYVEFPPIGSEPYRLTLGPYGYLWFELQTPAAPARDLDGEAGEPVLAATSLGEALAPPARAGFERLLIPFLMRQRWFGHKSRVIEAVSVTDFAELPDRSAALLLLEVRYAEGDRESYFAPVLSVPADRMLGLRDKHREALLATCRGSQGGFFDATVDDGFCQGLLGLIERGDSLRCESGTLVGVPGRLLQILRGDSSEALPASRSSAEQSNTSIRFGEKLILKLFRRPHRDPNPDGEMVRHLSEDCGFSHIPRFAGVLEFENHEGSRLTLGLLQELVANQGDGWTWSLEELRLFYEAHAVGPAPPAISEASKRPILSLSEEPLPELATTSMGLYLEAVATLGSRTAEMHLALAVESANPAFRPQPFDQGDLGLLADQFRARAGDVLDGLKSRLATLPDDLVELVGLLLARRRQVLDTFRRLEETKVVLQKIRIHGDFHLGQVLRARGDFVLLDFEGEPARSPEERRAFQSPLKDVAGMVRSFSYAAHAALATYLARRPQDADALEPWARLWSKYASAAFLASYRKVAAGATFLPTDNTGLARMLDAFLMDKAFYELGYELNHRPTWARIPLLGLLALLREPLGER
jgi:maltose alpha-D-glucosyltransferase/alpha-amylase